MNVNHLYHPEEIEDLYVLFCLIVTELRTEGFNLSFQFENIDFLRNVLRVYDLYTWFRFFLMMKWEDAQSIIG